MYIKEISVRNVRGFRDTRAVTIDLARPGGSLAGWTVLTGSNGSGKTTLLRAVALAIGGPGVARNLVPDFAGWVSAGESHAQAAVSLVHEPAFDHVTGNEPPPDGPFWASLAWDLPGPSMSVTGHHAASCRGPWDDNPVGWFCAAYGQSGHVMVGSAFTQQSLHNHGSAARIASLFRGDAPLTEGVSWLIGQHLRSLENRPGADELKRFALAVLDDGLLPEGYAVRDVDSEGLWVDHRGHRFPLQEMSDGYRSVIALVVDLLKQIHEAYGSLHATVVDGVMTVGAPGVVLIDDVEAHLDVSWQERIGGWLKRHFPRAQFIVSTHSPYICQAASERGLIRLPAPHDNRPPRIVDPEVHKRAVSTAGLR